MIDWERIKIWKSIALGVVWNAKVMVYKINISKQAPSKNKQFPSATAGGRASRELCVIGFPSFLVHVLFTVTLRC